MCYFKHLKELPSVQSIFDKPSIQQSSEAPIDEKENICVPNITYNLPQCSIISYSERLEDLIRMIEANNHLISSIQQKMVQQETKKQSDNEHALEGLPQTNCKDTLLAKLFKGLLINFNENFFSFKLITEPNFPSKFYKHRKYVFRIKLVSLSGRSGKTILNSNPIDICIGVFDKDGNWVSENVLGDPILEGLTQVRLFQGKAQFPRLLFNEISSNLPKQKMNLAIYVKPGLNCNKNGCENYQNIVNWKSIKPLIVKNVTVLSKKRKRFEECQP